MSSTSKGKVPSDIWSHSDNDIFENDAICAFAVLRSGDLIPGTLWNITPEDEWRKDAHYAVFPTELLRIPILATCPIDGVVLDPFMGTGSTILAAVEFGRKGIGFDISQKYLDIAQSRLIKVNGAAKEEYLDLPSKTIVQLKELLKKAGKPVSGKKSELIKRLNQ